MAPISETPPSLRLRWHLPVAVFLVVTAVSFTSLRIARTAILSDTILNAGVASTSPAQALPIDPIEASRQTFLKNLAVDNQRFDALNRQRNSLSPSHAGKAARAPALKPGQSGPTLAEVRSQLASALARLITLEKSTGTSGSEILSVRNRITRLQQSMARLESHKAPQHTAPPPTPPRAPSQIALLDEQIGQTQLQTITDLQGLARLPPEHPAVQDVQPLSTTALAANHTASHPLIQRAAPLLRRLHLSLSQRAAIVSISALYAFALSISLGFILSLFTLLVSESFRASA